MAAPSTRDSRRWDGSGEPRVCDFVGVGLANDGQLNAGMLMGRVPVPASRSCCDSFDVNIGIAANPIVEAPIDLPDNGIAQASFVHR